MEDNRRAPRPRSRPCRPARVADDAVVAVAAAAAGAASGNNKADAAAVAELDAVVDKSDYLLFFV